MWLGRRMNLSTFLPRLPSVLSATSSASDTQILVGVERTISTEFQLISDELINDSQLNFETNRKINQALKISSQALYHIHHNEIRHESLDEVKGCVDELTEIVNSHPNARGKYERLSLGIESLTEVQMFLYFLAHGKLSPLSTLCPCDDDEYIGSTLNFSQQLVRYCSNCALEGDVQSILFCKSFLSSLQGKYLEFFFRNGPLRKKFDGLKYSVKRIDGIVFDMSMVSPAALLTNASSLNSSASEGSPSLLGKRPLEDPIDAPADAPQATPSSFEDYPFFSSEEMDALKDRMNEFDRQREVVIKKTRDIQKYSKQAVFSFHGKRFSEGKGKLQAAKKIADEIKLIIAENPSLRLSSFSNSIEEWVEARLFEEFLQSQTVLTRQELEVEFDQKITIPEYVGGLSDLTGEIGRIAVLYGTSRDLKALTPVHRFCDAISRELNEITLSTGKFYQKSNTARQNTSKIEGLIYELTMNMKSERGIHRPLNSIEGNSNHNSKEERGGEERNDDEI